MPAMSPEKITVFCFGASYVVALALELLRLFRPHPLFRLIGLAFGFAGLVAQTLYLMSNNPPLASQFGSLLFLAWILVIFYLYGALHHRGNAWGVFVLPLICILVVIAAVSDRSSMDFEKGEWFWTWAHVGLLVLGAVGVCVGFLASVMYLVQAQRLKSKALPQKGLRLLNLERLELMNRRAINLAFPFFTAGVLVGFVLLAKSAGAVAWHDPKILAAGLLWLVFTILLYLRYSQQLRGRRVALWTIAAFTLLLVTMAWPHLGVGGGP
jgi:ABC-type transport system involved in cytochrome c biogenesis permease subunit